MPIRGYSEWAAGYATLFGFDREADVRMLDAWEGVFEAQRVTAAELDAAARVVAQNAPRWRSEHLTALQGAIRAARLADVRKQREVDDAEADSTRCVLCSWVGRVIVPHPNFLDADGEWLPTKSGTYATAAVICVCSRGKRLIDQVLALSDSEREKARVKVPLQLADYEKRNPDWQGQLLRMERQKLAEARAMSHAEEADKTFGELLRKLKGKKS